MKKLARISQTAAGVGAALLALPAVALAQDWLPDEGYSGNLADMIRTLLNTAIVLAAVVAVGFLVYNGFTYMTAAGDSQKTEKAQKGIASALIGLIICIAAAIIVNFVLGRLGVETGSLNG